MSGYILSAFADECADDFAGQLAALRELGIPASSCATSTAKT